MRQDGQALARSVLFLLNRAKQSAQDAFASQIGDHDLTPRQLAVLFAVDEADRPNQTQLTERTGVDRSTLSHIIGRLKKKGLVDRRRTNEDTRSYTVALTEAGRRMLESVEPLSRRIDSSILEAIPAKNRGAFVANLTAIMEKLERQTAQSS